MKRRFLFLVLSLALLLSAKAQGISANAARVYFTLGPGGSGTQHIKVTNPSNRPLELGISVGDWNYDTVGNNKMYEAGTLKSSAAAWIKVLPASYLTLQPGAQQDLTVEMDVPGHVSDSLKVHTAMIYLTQLNASDSKTAGGAALKVRVQMGIKIYHCFSDQNKPAMEITNFQDSLVTSKDSSTHRALCLQLSNTGDLWVEGSIKWELLNEQNGKTQKLEETKIYSLPGDKRLIVKDLPGDLPKGKYSITAIVNYGNKDDLKIAELEFLN